MVDIPFWIVVGVPPLLWVGVMYIYFSEEG